MIQWLSGQDTYTLHKPVRRRFPRRRVVVPGIDHQWQADLVDVSRLSTTNDGYKFLLTCIDVFSKYAWVIPLKNKTGASLIRAFETILQSGRKPVHLQTDKGTEFTNRAFQSYLRKHDITFFTTHNEETKASIAERFNKTLKTKMWKYFTRHNTTTYVDVLDDLVSSYNRSYHRSIKTEPVSVSVRNQKSVWQALYGERVKPAKSRLKPGDVVRISKAKKTFKKGYLPNWSEELFYVSSEKPGQPPLYVLKDVNGDLLVGSFYAWELQKVKPKESYRIERVLEERVKAGRKQVLVKWLGYSDDFNSWVDKAGLHVYKD